MCSRFHWVPVRTIDAHGGKRHGWGDCTRAHSSRPLRVGALHMDATLPSFSVHQESFTDRRREAPKSQEAGLWRGCQDGPACSLPALGPPAACSESSGCAGSCRAALACSAARAWHAVPAWLWLLRAVGLPHKLHVEGPEGSCAVTLLCYVAATAAVPTRRE